MNGLRVIAFCSIFNEVSGFFSCFVAGLTFIAQLRSSFTILISLLIGCFSHTPVIHPLIHPFLFNPHAQTTPESHPLTHARLF
jgi:hypothetical protein